MRKLTATLACVAMISSAGCSTIRDELRYPGGAPGRLLDKRTFDSSRSKQLQLLRATLALAIAARIGEASVATEDADAFARQLTEASRELNYTAVDAGYPYFDTIDEEVVMVETCVVTKPGESMVGALATDRTYLMIDAACPGFYVNFESNIARIEARIVRAMLTSLPSDRAREFLEDLSQGNLLSALWSMTRSLGDIAGAFHRGAGVYRSGLENVAASTKRCEFDASLSNPPQDRAYIQERDTVLIAAACLGLSLDSLFDDDDIEAIDLPRYVDPVAFMALFRIARTSCVALPLKNTPNDPDATEEARKFRSTSCGEVVFNPARRPDSIAIEQETQGGQAGTEAGAESADENEEMPLPPP